MKSPWMVNVYMDGIMRGVNSRAVGRWLVGRWLANGGTFKKNQFLFANDTSQVADSENKLCKLVR